MTLSDVAATQRHKLRRLASENGRSWGNTVIKAFEADPDFSLRDRIEAMAKDLERPYDPGFDRPSAKGIARRLREVLDPSVDPSDQKVPR